MKYLLYFFLTLTIISYSCTRDVIVPDAVSNCDDKTIYFEQDLLPVIVSSCATAGCHADKHPEEGIRLNNTGNILKYVKKGNPKKSKLYKYLAGVVSSNDDDAMPPSPNNPLTDQQISDIYTWIKDGAVLYECDENCTSTDAKYQSEVFPIIEKYCIGCHGSVSPNGNVRLNNYSKIKQYASSGQLMGTINHANGYSQMPPSGTSVSSCDKKKIQAWIDAGTLDN